MERNHSLSLLLAVSSFVYMNPASAWSWQLGIVNNLEEPLNYKFNQNNSGNAWAEDGTKNSGVVKPSDTVMFSMTTGGTFNKTTDGVLTLSNSRGLNCNIRYYQRSVYSAHNLGTWELEGNSNSPECSGLFLSSTEASDDTWDPLKLIFNSVKFPRLTKGQMQCSGMDNCVVVNPKNYNVGWAVRNINRQTHIADYEKLSVGQVLGTHNSVISRNYTNTSFMTNMSYADPNQYITLTEQLNLGIRQFEFDFLEENDFTICHYKSEDSLLDNFAQMFVCKDNYSLAASFQELQKWLIAYPNELLYIYFDNTQPWDESRVQRLNALLNNIFADKILTKYDVISASLPVENLTRDDIVHKYKRNLIFYAHNPDVAFNSSPYVFFKVSGNDSARLHDDRNISEFPDLKKLCGEDKSCFVSGLYPADVFHKTIFAIREDRTHLQQQKGSHQDTSVYMTNAKLKDAMSYPINIFAFDKLSLNDSRLYTAVWSFAFPYPLSTDEGGASYAFIDPMSGKFSNRKLSETRLDVLCYNNAGNKWFVAADSISKPESFHNDVLIQIANDFCAKQNAKFATPVSDYQLDEIKRAGMIVHPTIINYLYDLSINEWVPNNQSNMNF